MTNPTSTQTAASYLDLEEVLDYLGMDEDDEMLTEKQRRKMQRFIDSACTWAQGPEGANRPIAPTQFQQREDGWSGEYIQLHNSPFLELVLCREWQSIGGFIDLPESTPENPVEGIQINYASSRIMRVFAGYSWPRPFFPGSRNIEITYIAGFNPLPSDIWEATMELVAWKYRNTQEATKTFDRLGDEYGGTANNGLYPGVPDRIADVLSGYRLPGIG